MNCPPKRKTQRPHLLPHMKPGDLYFDGRYWCAPDPAGDGAENQIGETDLRLKLNARIFLPAKKPIEPKPRFFLADIGICTAGNLTTISAQAKAGKTAAIGAMIAGVFGNDDRDFLGFKSENPNGLAVIHLDTEQSTFDHWKIIDTARRRAGAKIPGWLRSYCVTGFSSSETRASIPMLLNEAAQKYGGVHSLILDGAADAVADVNSAEESNAFVSELHALAIQYDCPIICVIHLNPGSDFKTRGHLGSQLERKAETNLKLEKGEDEISVIWADKNRRKSIPKKSGPCFAWSEDEHLHVAVDNPAEAKADAKNESRRATMLQDAELIFAHGKNLPFRDVVASIEKRFALQRAGARRRLENWRQAGIIERCETGFYSLAK